MSRKNGHYAHEAGQPSAFVRGAWEKAKPDIRKVIEREAGALLNAAALTPRARAAIRYWIGDPPDRAKFAAKVTEGDLMDWTPNCGRKTVRELREWLAEGGFELRRR